MATPDMDVIKEIPGYKVILKAILKSQIQQLVQQLASCTEEESVILTANVSDGTLCHLGSDSGKSFLEEKDDFKAQFLGFCLQRHNKKKQEEAREKERQEQAQLFSSQMSPRFSGPGQVYMPGMSPGISPSMHMPQRRSRPYPVSRPMRRPNPRPVLSNVMRPHTSTAPEPGIKMEPDDNDTNLSGSSQPTSPGSQSGSVDNTANNSAQLSLDSDLSGLMDSTQSDSNQTATVEQTPGPSSETGVKVENISESEFELEITGVELGSKPSGADSEGSGDSWRSPPGNMGGATGVSGDLQGSQSQQEYRTKYEAILFEGLEKQVDSAIAELSESANQSEDLARLHGRHFPRKIQGTAGANIRKKRCKLCQKFRGLRRETTFMCDLCPRKPALCILPCFELYHTVKDYK